MPPPQVARRRASQKHAANIEKRGKVPPTLRKKEDQYPVGPIILGFLIFVVCGSAIFQLLQSIQSQAPPTA